MTVLESVTVTVETVETAVVTVETTVETPGDSDSDSVTV